MLNDVWSSIHELLTIMVVEFDPSDYTDGMLPPDSVAAIHDYMQTAVYDYNRFILPKNFDSLPIYFTGQAAQSAYLMIRTSYECMEEYGLDGAVNIVYDLAVHGIQNVYAGALPDAS